MVTLTLEGALRLVRPDRVPDGAVSRDHLRDQWRSQSLVALRRLEGETRLRREHRQRTSRRHRHHHEQELKRLAAGWVLVKMPSQTVMLGDWVDDRLYDTIGFVGRPWQRPLSRGQRRHRRRRLAAERRGVIA